ncbi:histidine kinase dimerization/phospho-acceptor domain-containing protein [Desulfovibrio sp. 86]|uniref:histidine kinase n=1 Tax=uncultured Desulfovibrio sp. TaxID=167968 RepID=A0A212L8Z1_9BACT|nr:histidine kinase dimerization/phospho-acceptor domain-containing protein [Desulfovibrio sp. 86]SCM73990.1 Histidine kinase [uncultured Desulfovibrio sp.]VZH34570.1 Histidine kinase [Desulfovibrio sp. 86]
MAPAFTPPPTSSHVRPPARSGTVFARRILVAFVFLALGMGTALSIVGHLSFDYLGTYLVGWHARPVMETLIEAEKRAWEAEDSGRDQLYYGEDLATAMHWTFLVGKQVSPQWRDLPDGLHFVENDAEFVLIERRDGVEYMLRGGTGGFQALKDRLNGILLLCALAGLAVAVLLAVVLSRRLTDPLRRLTLAVEGRPAAGMNRMAAGSEAARDPNSAMRADPQADRAMTVLVTPADIPMTDMDDEVGVLARAIAAREEALWRFVQRESHFTGDVSHELRTPLTVMQGGLEVLELRLERLQQGEDLAPVVSRLLRTTGRMSDTVRTLLLLARRPEEIQFQVLDCAALLREVIGEMEREGLAHAKEVAGESGNASAASCLPHLVELMLRSEPSPEQRSGDSSAPEPHGDLSAPEPRDGDSSEPEPQGGDSSEPEAQGGDSSGPVLSHNVFAGPPRAASTGPSARASAGASARPRSFAPPAVALSTAMPAHAPARAQRELAIIIFKNLLDNACKYTENGRAFVLLESGRMLVGNKGRTPCDVDIFARGVRRRTTTDHNAYGDGAGYGLGLSLAQRACERLGWLLELLPSAYIGAEEITVFRLIFPPAAQGEDV